MAPMPIPPIAVGKIQGFEKGLVKMSPTIHRQSKLLRRYRNFCFWSANIPFHEIFHFMKYSIS